MSGKEHMSGDHTKYHETAEIPKREWVGLTEEEKDSILWQCHKHGGSYLLLFRLVEAKLKEKNT